MTEPRPFFIVASARSGTTMLRLILNQHSEIAVPPESRFITELWEGSSEVESESFLRRLSTHPRFAAWELPIEAVREQLQGRFRVSYREAISAAYRAYASSKSKWRWGDKTPRYVEHIPFLADLFPDSRFIHLVRDGRDVALSYADVSFGPKTVATSAALWAKRVSAGLHQGHKLEPGRYVEIRYEDLVEEPEAQLKELCDFLDISFEPAMVEGASATDEDVLARASIYNPHVTDRPKSGVREWRRTMPARHVEIFETIAGAELSELDYPRLYMHPGLTARVEAFLGRLGIPVGRYATRMRKLVRR